MRAEQLKVVLAVGVEWGRYDHIPATQPPKVFKERSDIFDVFDYIKGRDYSKLTNDVLQR